MKVMKTTAGALALVGALAFGIPAMAAPVASSTATLKQAVSSDVVNVQWRGRGHWHGGHWGRGAAAAGIGLAAGALIGSAVANSYAGPYGYYDGAYAYAPGYYVAPGYGGSVINDYCGHYDSSGVKRFDNCY